MELKGNTLDDLSAVIGFSATVRLAAWYGDAVNMYVPLEVNEDQTIVKLIGLSLAQKLSKEWGGQRIAVPRLAAYERDSNYRLIMRMLQQGFEVREISRSLRQSDRRIMQVARELEALGLLEPVVPKGRKTEE
ncbi:MAG: hypothetical protein RIS35_3766 [Pseudomonadota bacterium]|jgi:hypothetical protein